jgi:hypothetical protein
VRAATEFRLEPARELPEQLRVAPHPVQNRRVRGLVAEVLPQEVAGLAQRMPFDVEVQRLYDDFFGVVLVLEAVALDEVFSSPCSGGLGWSCTCPCIYPPA